MKTVLKRVMGLALVLAMVVGILYGIGTPVAKAEGTNTGVNVGTIVTGGATKLAENTSGGTTWSYRYRYREFSLDLNVANQVENYGDHLQLYLKVEFENEKAANALSGCFVELGNNKTTNDTEELQWSLQSLQNVSYNEQEPTYDVYLKFAEADKNDSGFSYEKVLQHFQIYIPKDKSYMADAAGIIVKEVKVISTAPVVIAKYTDAVAGTQPTGKFDADHYAFSGWYTDAAASTTPYTGTTASEAYAKFVTKDVLGLKSQYELNTVSDDEMLVLANCDSKTTITDDVTYTMNENSSNTFAVVDGASDFMEGTGALSCTGSVQEFACVKALNNGKFNIAPYQTGKLHFWLKLTDDENVLGNNKIIVQISDRDNWRNRLEWTINSSDLPIGEWKEFNLNLYEASFSKEVGEGTTDAKRENANSFEDLNTPNMDRVRLYFSTTLTENYTAYIDDIRLVKGFDGKIFDECDTTNGKTQMGYLPTPSTITGAQGMAYALKNEQVGAHYRLNSETDASSYVENGYLHLMLYNPTNWSESIDTLVVELGSSCERYSTGADGRACVRFTKKLKELEVGWNELDFDLSNPSYRSETADDTGTYEGTKRPAIEWDKVIRMKVSTQSGAKMGSMYLDDIRIISKTETSHDMGGNVSRKASLRFITSVDSLNYQNAGFDIKIGEQAIARPYVSTGVYDTLFALGTGRSFIPADLFVSQSAHLSTFRINNIPETALETNVTVTPCWTTQDGTKVTGTSKVGTVMQWIYGTTRVAE